MLVSQCFSTFLLKRNPLERLDCSRNHTRVCSIPNGQKQHFSVLSSLHKKHRLIQVYVCNTVLSVIVAQIKNKLAWPDN